MNIEKHSDHQLLFLLQSKDDKALDLIYDLYAPCLYGLIVKKVNDVKLASEILENTFNRIWKEGISKENLKNRLITWLISATYKTALQDFNINFAYSNLNPVIKLDTASKVSKYAVLRNEL